MNPASPVLPGLKEREIVFARNQPQYLELPALRCSGKDGRVITRWRLSWLERLRVFWMGDLYLEVLTFWNPLQPVRPGVVPPAFDRE